MPFGSGLFADGTFTAIDVTGNITSSGGLLILTTPKTPSAANDTGTVGTICWDASYLYVCTATDTWERVAIASW
jgi:hypothetical protein